jgi:microcystin-dependent protein
MPSTPLGALNVPNTGDLPGAWGTTAVNANMSALDGYGRGAVTLSVSSATSFSLTAPAGSITPGSGPTQSQNAVIKFTGTLSGNIFITLPLPGLYIFENQCTVGSFFIQVGGAVAGTSVVGLPPGEPRQVYNDGSNVKFVNMPHVGSYLDLAVGTTPRWMSATLPLPYLWCGGGIHTSSLYPALNAQIGSTFGGDGVSTFGVPDLQNRWRVPLGITTARITVPFDGTQFGVSGGGQTQSITQTNLPNIGLAVTITDSRTYQTQNGLYPSSGGPFGLPGGSNAGLAAVQTVVPSTTTLTGIATTGGSGTAFSIIDPAVVAGMTFIKT